MHIIDASEIIPAMDAYELLLSTRPEIIPSIGFTVLQQSIDLDGIQHRVALGSNALQPGTDTGNNGIVTLHREAPSATFTEYRLTLLNFAPSPKLPRLTSTRFRRLGSAVSATTYFHDDQGRRNKCEGPTSLRQFHAGLAGSMLSSNNAKQLLISVDARRLAYQAQLRNPNIAPFNKKQIQNALDQTKLK